ncbi:MAG: DUF934 domain-containing protein [Proteobacteria bacterium]|nr:DUF934 domain-containing protein [Pseudomonadota bacterium]
MPRLIDRLGPAEDIWTVLGAEDALPSSGSVIVALERLDEALAAGLELGVHLPNDTDPEGVKPHFDRLSLISVDFPSFTDGRGFSIGHCLRALGYEGRLRATGPVISDQFDFLLACGFDEVLLPDSVAERQPPEHWAAAEGRITLGYQRGLAGRGSILDARRAAGDG